MQLGLSTLRRAPISGLTAVTVVTALVLVPVTNADAAVTPLVAQAFTNSTVTNEWYLPPASAGTNDTCLTAGASAATLPIPGCALATADANGSGTLRLTPNVGTKVGSTFYQTSLPTSAGLDITFNTYQYNTSSAQGADGIGFALAAVDPANPTPPSVTGQTGGALGYSPHGSGAGVPYGYIGYGLDVYGNFENSGYSGSGCTTPTGLTSGGVYPESMTVHGPGNGTAGYCILGTTATTAAKTSGGGSAGETISNLGGQYLDQYNSKVRPSPVAAEIAMNPTNAAASTASGLSIPANSYLIQVTPYATATGGTGTPVQLSGLLPTTSNSTVLAGFPSSWINPATGIPYQVSFGWVSSTGGSNEIHEVDSLTATTLSGQLPVLSLGLTDNEHEAFLTSNHADVTLSPAISSAGGPEIDPLTVTDTFPAGVVPGTATSSSLWTCTTSGQKVTCTYAPSAYIASGTALPTIDVPVTTSGTTAGSLVNTARVGSIDGAPDATTLYYSVSKFAATATPASVPYGTADVLGYTGLPANATETVVYKTGTTPLCTVTLGSATTCSTSASLVPGTYPVTATYSGDGAYLGATATSTFTVTKASPAITATATPSSAPWGTAVTLSAGNVPTAATGSITFVSGATTLCTASLPTLTCATSATLNAGSYPVTATYNGDSNYNSSSATTNFVIVATATSFTVAPTPATVTYGTATSLAQTGLPAGATGTVVYRSGSTALCTETLPALSCVTPTTQPAGSVPVTATYSGDTHWAGSTATTTYLVNQASTTLAASATPASVPYQSADTLGYSGLPAAATGTVTFASGGTTICVATLPATSCATPTTQAVGSYVVTATYSGDGNFTGSTAGTSYAVTLEASPFTASATPGSVAYGTAVTLAESGLLTGATGLVTMKANGSTLCTFTRGTATSCLTSSTLDPGTYNVTASYAGDSNHAAATTTTSFVVTQVASPFTATASPASTGFGNSVTLGESGLVAGATGTVTFASGGSTLCTATLPATSCGTSTTLAAGAYAITATYSGDTDHAGSSAGTNLTITTLATSFTASATPATVTYGNVVTLAESGIATAATGTVTFSSGGSTLCVATLPATSCGTDPTLAVGSYSTTATYSGDNNYVGSTAATSFSVTQIPTAVAASVAPASVEYGTATTLKESGLPGAATGTVTFTSGGATLCTVTLGSGSTCTTPTSLVVAGYPVTATYSGDATHLGSSDTTSFTVTKQTTSLTAAAAPATTTYGNAVNLSDAGLAAGATGTVTFTSGTTTLCTLDPVTDTSCTTTATLDPATYPVTATYSGDSNHVGGTAGTTFDITKAAAPFTATASPSSVVYGHAVTLTASSLPAGATGSVVFKSGGTTLCTVALAGGTSCLTTATLDPATYPVTATYSGDAHFSTAMDTTTFAVTQQSTSLAVSPSPAVVPYGTAVSLVESGLPAGATGTVTLDWGTAASCVVTIGSGTACPTPADLDPATYTETGHYSGDTDYAASSATSSFTVTKAPTAVVAGTTPATVTYGHAVTLKESGLPAAATGTVTFSSGGSTLCTVSLGGPSSCPTLATLAVGSYPVTAAYSGDTDYAASSDSTSFEVDQAPTAITASAAPTSVAYGTAVILTAANVPAAATGSIVFVSGSATLCSATLPALSCQTSSTLDARSYPVTATYSGDTDYATSSAATAFSVTPLTTHLAVGASPATTTYGNPITLTTGGLPADATGLVTFTSGGHTLCVVDVGITSTCSTISTLAVGSYVVTGTYAGDPDHAGSSATTGFSITPASTLLTATATPSSVPYGSAVTLAEGNLPADATGTVTFTSGTQGLCTVDVATDTSCTTSATLAVATYPVTAHYSGDGSYSASSASTGFAVTPAGSAVVVTAAPGTVDYGTAVTLTEAGLPAGATGTVTFTSGTTPLCTVAVASATSCQTSATLAPAGYPVTGTYSGDSHFAGSSDSTSFTVDQAVTHVTGSGPATSPYAAPITLSIAGLPAATTGTVTLKDGSTTLCSVTLPGGSCVVSQTLTPGTYPVTVDYPGDTDYVGSTDSFSFVVAQATTSVTATASPTSVSYGDPVTLTPGGLPAGAGGTVTFSSGGTTLCTVLLGTATSCQTSTTLPAAGYPVDVSYSGDSNYAGSSTTTSFTVGAASTSFTVTPSPATADFGTAVTLTPAGLPTGATGTVLMTSGMTTLCTVLLGTQSSCAAPASTPVGSYPVHAAYSGDSNFTASSASTSFAVVKAPSPFTADATPPSAPYGTAVTLAESGLPSGAGGTVTFHHGATTYCTATLPATSCATAVTLDPATYPVTASYSGDGSYVASSATTTFDVTQAPVTLAASATPSSTSYGTTVTLTGGGLPSGATGSVVFTTGTTTLCSTTLPATSCVTPALLAPGSYPVTAAYSGDTDYQSAAASTTFTVGKAATAVTAAATPGAVSYGNPVTLTDGNLPAAATGTVTFTSGTTTLCTVDIVLASSCQTSASLVANTYPVTATYSGDADWASSSTTTTFSVGTATTTLTATATPPTVAYGTPVTLVPSGLPASSTGTVTFSTGTQTLCTLIIGVATSCDTSATVDSGSYPVDAAYSGDNNHSPANATTTFTVTKGAVTIAASATPTAAAYGTQVTLAATGVPAGASGTLTFTSSGVPVCTATLPATSCGAPAGLPPGAYDVTVTYSGDPDHSQATGTTSFTVAPAATTFAATASPAAVPHGSSSTLSFSGLPAAATGTVTFTSGGVTLCTVTIGAGTIGAATGCPTSTTLPTGDYQVTATYSGDADFTGSMAATGFTVGPVADTFNTTGPVGQPQQTATDPGGTTITLLDKVGRPVLKVVEAGEGTYSLNPVTGVITFTPLPHFAGTVEPVRYRITDANGQSSTGTYRAVVVPPAAPHPVSWSTTGPVNSDQHAMVVVPAGDSITLADSHGRSVTTIEVSGKGTYSVDKRTGVLTFQPDAGFVGRPGTVTYRISDPYGQVGAATYTASVYATHLPPVPVHGSPLPVQPPGLPSNLPFTGFNAQRMLLVTTFMVSAGTVLVLASRRSITGRLFRRES